MSERTVMQSIRPGQIITTVPKTSVYQAACVMTEANTGSIIVVDGAGKMLGILTERDLMTKVVAQALQPEEIAVSEVMTKNPRFVSPETSVAEAVLIMKAGGFRHLPILSNDKLVAVFSIRDASPRELIEADKKAEYLELVSESIGY